MGFCLPWFFSPKLSTALLPRALPQLRQQVPFKTRLPSRPELHQFSHLRVPLAVLIPLPPVGLVRSIPICAFTILPLRWSKVGMTNVRCKQMPSGPAPLLLHIVFNFLNLFVIRFSEQPLWPTQLAAQRRRAQTL